MANEKLTWVELRKAVAQMSGYSEQDVGKFLNTLLDTIVIGLKKDKQVKIKGIGTFALKAVAPRKSVNIATGETFVIDGYNKLTFNAESNLKESVEKRIEHPKTNEIMDEINPNPMRKLGEQADEIIDILADLGQAPDTQPIEKNTPQIETKVDEEEMNPEEVTELQEEILPNEEVQPSEEVTTEIEPTIPPANNPAPNRKCNWVCWTVVGILLAIIIGGGIYFREAIIQWWLCMQDCQPTELVEGAPISPTPAPVPLTEQPREYVNFIGIERVGDNSRLAWIAYKYYAQKDLWVFIYEANRDLISHPNYVRPNQYIRIPELDEKWRNLNNPELKQLVDSLAIEYLK